MGPSTAHAAVHLARMRLTGLLRKSPGNGAFLLSGGGEGLDRGRGLLRGLDHREMGSRRNALDSEPWVPGGELLLGLVKGGILRLPVDVKSAGRRRLHPLVG